MQVKNQKSRMNFTTFVQKKDKVASPLEDDFEIIEDDDKETPQNGTSTKTIALKSRN